MLDVGPLAIKPFGSLGVAGSPRLLGQGGFDR
jgi:hypothetical protein